MLSWYSGRERRRLECCECMSTRPPATSVRSGSVTGVSLMKARLLPLAEISRLTMIWPSFQSRSFASKISFSVTATLSNTPSITAFPSLLASTLLSALSPISREMAPIITDLPAPVSPVRIVSPSLKVSSTLSMSA